MPPVVTPAVGLTDVTTGVPKVKRSATDIAEVPTALVTVISTVPAACAGDTAVICVPELMTKLAAAVPPKLTAVAPPKPVPVMITEVPPPVLPAPGLTEVTTGDPKVNRSATDAAEVPTALVTVISTEPAACAGDTAVICVPELMTKLAAAVPPKLTAVAPPKPVPVITTEVPPAVLPAPGLTDVTTGVPKVNRSAVEIAEVPTAFVTVISTEPAACAGDTAVICVPELMTKLAAAVPPKLTAVAPPKPVPVITTEVPPAVLPAPGLTEVTTGVPKVNRSAVDMAEVPTAFVTVISTEPAACAGDTAVICVPELITKLAAAVPPKLTAVASPRPVPVMMTEVPPAVVPEPG